ncbi:hypothetical protein [Streptomyces sp. bgisy100]|uniref:hypothetical protein n=1 Tax=Streptomyces sp. bgisy100 TaxID=3413783 RepID=UPI003D75A28D
MQTGTDMWAALTSLLGVVLGGALSFAAQQSARRSAERAEARRRSDEAAETRRADRISHLVAFIVAVQEAERVAVDRCLDRSADEQSRRQRAEATIDRLWVLQKTIHMLCAPQVNNAARVLVFALQQVLREGPSGSPESVVEQVAAHVRPSRNAFLDTARECLD